MAAHFPLIFPPGGMINKDFLHHLTFTFMMNSLRGGVYGFCGTWLRYSQRLGWEYHSAPLRLAFHAKKHTLHPVQLPDLG